MRRRGVLLVRKVDPRSECASLGGSRRQKSGPASDIQYSRARGDCTRVQQGLARLACQCIGRDGDYRPASMDGFERSRLP